MFALIRVALVLVSLYSNKTLTKTLQLLWLSLTMKVDWSVHHGFLKGQQQSRKCLWHTCWMVYVVVQCSFILIFIFSVFCMYTVQVHVCECRFLWKPGVLNAPGVANKAPASEMSEGQREENMARLVSDLHCHRHFHCDLKQVSLPV